ncbi:hydantoinase/oxoprolinase family protein [Terrihabitans sp. B22-R8]|uniref:hydantoinase/oxoprolinase family protein n=1 Tax=Terrihabitans sp. B22-R8 TaxID=3425128 RepID=UPI00403C1102
MNFRIAVDIGGTFTDGVIESLPGGQVFLAKRLTTHDDPGEALSKVVDDLLAAVEGNGGELASDRVVDVVHGSTLVTNCLIERKGASTALVTTAGMADILDIRREVRYDLYDLNLEMPDPLVPREMRFELSERVAANGSVIAAPNPQDVADLIARIRAAGVSSVAVSFLHSCINAENEIEVGRAIREELPDVSISLSSRVASEIREFERTTTATANAYVQPLVKAYLNELESRLKQAGISAALRIMLSSGGTTTAAVAADVPIAAVESGPAGGVLSAVNAGRASGFNDVLAFDMGGTTAKVCTVTGGEPSVVHLFETARVRRFKKGSGLPLLVASIDLIEIGSGGGSIARVSDLGLLTVGPESASSHPGPACYGLGGKEPTVTDADLTLGYLNPKFFLGGKMELHPEAAVQALDAVGGRLNLSAEDTAKGIFNVVNEAMAGAARVHIAEKAQDPRQFTLIATGGAGPVHAVEIARKLRVPRVLFPIGAGTGSCLGFLAAPVRVERSWSRPSRLDASFNWEEARTAMTAMRQAAGEEIAGGLPTSTIVDWYLLVEMRYLGQGANVVVRFPYEEPGADFVPSLIDAFQEKYRETYGGTLPAGQPEVVTWRVIGSTRQDIREFVWPTVSDRGAPIEPAARRAAFCPVEDAMREIPVYHRYGLPPGTALSGPLILEEDESTIVVPMTARIEVLENLSILVTLEA